MKVQTCFSHNDKNSMPPEWSWSSMTRKHVTASFLSQRALRRYQKRLERQNKKEIQNRL